jgi:hypothetical protein
MRPSAIFLRQAWAIKAWLEPYLRGVRGTSQPHAFRFTMDGHGKIEMWSKDYVSTTSPWLGPQQFLNIVPTGEPPTLQPAQLDDHILQDTMTALKNLDDHIALAATYTDIVERFNRPSLHDQLSHPFTWVYDYSLPPEETFDSSALVPPLNARMTLTGRSSLEMTPVIPDIGAIVALAADDNQYWLGLVKRTTRARVFVLWLEKDDDGIWSLITQDECSQELSTIIAHDVSLDLDNRMRDALHDRLMRARLAWNESEADEHVTDNDHDND